MRRPLRLSKVWKSQTSRRDAIDQESTARSATGAHNLLSQGGEAPTREVHPALLNLHDDVHSGSVCGLGCCQRTEHQRWPSPRPLILPMHLSRLVRTQSPWGLSLCQSALCSMRRPHHGKTLMQTRRKALGGSTVSHSATATIVVALMYR